MAVAKIQSPSDILTILAQVNDPRVDRTKRHPLVDILFIGLVATLCGCDSWVDVERFAQAKEDWFRRFLDLQGGIPSHDTLSRVFGMLKPQELENCFKRWLVAIHQASGGRHVAIDGKTMINSLDKASGQAALHLLSAWSVEGRVVLGQKATDKKSNEITAIPKLLKQLELKGGLVTIDAMGCQKSIAKQIRDENADYILALKGNHPILAEAVTNAFIDVTASDSASNNAKGVRRFTKRSSSGDGHEVREYTIMPVPDDLPGREDWAGLRCIGMVVRRRTTPSGETGSVRYYITSLPATVREFAKAVRNHWAVENTLHWSLDVTFTEHKSRIHKGNGPEIAAWLRRLVLSIVKQDTSIKASLRGKRRICGWDENALETILTGFTGD